MNFEEIETLVLDTLYFRRMVPNRTCLQVNLAGRELEQQSAEVLPQIEHVLNTVVAPVSLQHPKRLVFPGSTDRWYELDPFPGLSGLLGAYMLIGSKHNVARIVGFLRTLPAPLQAEVVALVPVFFRKARFRPQEKEVNELKTLPDEQLLSFVEEGSQSADNTLRENAARVLSFFVSTD